MCGGCPLEALPGHHGRKTQWVEGRHSVWQRSILTACSGKLSYFGSDCFMNYFLVQYKRIVAAVPVTHPITEWKEIDFLLP
jgi:hypothetical protein